jgi:hypothetical protein
MARHRGIPVVQSQLVEVYSSDIRICVSGCIHSVMNIMSLNPTFRETTPDVGSLDLSGSNPNLLPQFVAQARKNVSESFVLGQTFSQNLSGSQGARFHWWLDRIPILFVKRRNCSQQDDIRKNCYEFCSEI